jgi:hypothetical protein
MYQFTNALRKVLLWTGAVITWLILLLWTLWAFGALWFDFPLAGLQPWAAAGFAVLVLLAVILVKPRRWAKLAVALTPMR